MTQIVLNILKPIIFHVSLERTEVKNVVADNLSVRLINDHVEICVVFWHRDVDVLVQAISGLINEFDLPLPRRATVVLLLNDRVA